jgi:hypothetical protein
MAIQIRTWRRTGARRRDAFELMPPAFGSASVVTSEL